MLNVPAVCRLTGDAGPFVKGQQAGMEQLGQRPAAGIRRSRDRERPPCVANGQDGAVRCAEAFLPELGLARRSFAIAGVRRDSSDARCLRGSAAPGGRARPWPCARLPRPVVPSDHPGDRSQPHPAARRKVCPDARAGTGANPVHPILVRWPNGRRSVVPTHASFSSKSSRTLGPLTISKRWWPR